MDLGRDRKPMDRGPGLKLTRTNADFRQRDQMRNAPQRTPRPRARQGLADERGRAWRIAGPCFWPPDPQTADQPTADRDASRRRGPPPSHGPPPSRPHSQTEQGQTEQGQDLDAAADSDLAGTAAENPG